MKVLYFLSAVVTVATVTDAANAVALSQRTIAGKVSVQSDLSTFYQAMQIADLTKFFDCPEFCEHYTIFCPKDDAFYQFPHLHWFDDIGDSEQYPYKEHLKQLVQYHVIPGRIYEDDFMGTEYFETLQGQIVVSSAVSSNADNTVTLNGNALVIGNDKWARNGLIQGVSEVLLPPFAEESVSSVVARVASNFWKALVLVGVDPLLLNHQAGPWTVLAPTDFSFRESAMEKAMQSNDIEALKRLVKYHILPNRVVLGEEFEGNKTFFTLLDGSQIAGDDVGVTTSNILGFNGIVHIVDNVLQPPLPDLWSLIADMPELDSFREAMISAGLSSSLQAAGPITLFAPSNEAMGSFQVRRGNRKDRRDLLYYIVEGRHYRKDLSDRLFRTGSRENVLVDLRRDGEVVLNGNVKVSSFNQQASNGILHIVSQRLYRPRDLMATATSEGLTSFTHAVALSNLTTAFREEGPYTIFAWTNNAWNRLDSNVADELLNNPERLRKLVLYHIVPKYLLFDDLRDGGNYTTLLRNEFDVSFDYLGGSSSSFHVQINDAYVTGFDVIASNGCIHRISNVLEIP